MEELLNEDEEKEQQVEIPKEIEITNIHHYKVNGEIDSLKVRYGIYHNGNLIKRGASYVDKDLSYEEIKDYLEDKFKYQKIEQFENALYNIEEVEEVTEIQEEGEF